MARDTLIIAIAQGIENETIERFVRLTNNSQKMKHFDIHIETGNADASKFYKTRLLNDCIKKYIKKYDFIIQTDIDLIIPFGLVDRTVKVAAAGCNMSHCVLRYIKPEEIEGLSYDKFPWQKWKTYKKTYCSGCWNGATSETWRKSGGWNPDMFGWGAEDTEFKNRSIRRGVNWKNIYDMPLVHINHPPRTPVRPKDNMKFAKVYGPKADFLKEE
jgi:hypothetical protein